VTAYDAARWTDFALAQLGASAALLGLVFVGLSINLRDVVGSSALVNRAGEAVVALFGVLVAATAVLIPAQSDDALGIELLVLGAILLAAIARLQIADSEPIPDDRRPPRSSRVSRHVLGLGAPLLIVVAAITFLAGAGGGLYWWPGAIVVAYASAIANAWVLLIEILR
jgi:uncharacterized membrane protein